MRNASARWQKRLLWLFGVRHAWIVPMSSVGYLKGVTVYMAGRGKAAEDRFHATRDQVHLRAIHFFAELRRPRRRFPTRRPARRCRPGR
ncbi:MAG: hypothetical protein R3F55_16640 [Alphaproteobacteria bacterium]